MNCCHNNVELTIKQTVIRLFCKECRCIGSIYRDFMGDRKFKKMQKAFDILKSEIDKAKETGVIFNVDGE